MKFDRWRTLCIISGGAIMGWMAGFVSPSPEGNSDRKNVLHSEGAPAGTGPMERTPKASGNKLAGRMMGGSTDVESSLATLLSIVNPFQRTRDLFDWVAKLSPDEARQCLTFANRWPGYERNEIVSMLAGRWAESDPEAAAQFMFSMPVDVTVSNAMGAVMAHWTRQDPDRALAWALQRTGPGRFVAIHNVVKALAQSDPVAALRFVSNLPNGSVKAYAFSSLFTEWASQNPVAASAQVQALPSGSTRELVLDAVASAWGEKDPRSALTWARSLGLFGERQSATQRIMGNWAINDFEAAAAYVQRSIPEAQRLSVISNMVNAFAFSGRATDARARKLIELLPVGVRSDAVWRLAGYWAESREPDLAAQYVASVLPPGEDRNESLNHALSIWVRADLPRALEWVTQIPERDTRKAGMQVISQQWAKYDPAAAADYWAKNLPNDSALVDIAGEWARKEPAKALAWAKELPEGKSRTNALSRILGEMADNDPSEATSQWLQLSAKAQGAAAGQIARRWAAKDPSAAATWASGLSEGDSRAAAWSGLAGEWARKDASATANWLQKLPMGTARDGAVSAFAWQIVTSDPEGAKAWAGSIGDGEVQKKTLDRIAKKLDGKK